MLRLNLEGIVPEHIMDLLRLIDPSIDSALSKSASIHARLLSYQGAALYILAGQYDRLGATMLDIGTASGYSASLMAWAAPGAGITTLNSARHEIPEATFNLGRFRNVEIMCIASWDYLEVYGGAGFDLVFVDSDHKHIARDMPFWNLVKPGGLMLFHDYSRLACPPVFNAVNGLAEVLGRSPDVVVVDTDDIGMAGFYKE